MSIYDNYARTQDGTVVIRHSARDQWGRRGWPPRMAREYARHIINLADQAERDDPRVAELVHILELGSDEETMEDLALRLHRAGYRKKI